MLEMKLSLTSPSSHRFNISKIYILVPGQLQTSTSTSTTEETRRKSRSWKKTRIIRLVNIPMWMMNVATVQVIVGISRVCIISLFSKQSYHHFTYDSHHCFCKVFFLCCPMIDTSFIDFMSTQFFAVVAICCSLWIGLTYHWNDGFFIIESEASAGINIIIIIISIIIIYLLLPIEVWP